MASAERTPLLHQATVGITFGVLAGLVLSTRLLQSRHSAGMRNLALGPLEAEGEETVDASLVQSGLQNVRQRVTAARERCGQTAVRLVAVSKYQPVAAIMAAYNAEQRVFGENYVQELLAKCPALPADIQWHFIGHLQSRKAKLLVRGCPNLTIVETVDSIKIADLLNKAVEEMGRTPLKVFIQVNSSGEASKSGVSPGDEVPLAQHIYHNCPGLILAGLMTIGNADYECVASNFECLQQCRQRISETLGLPGKALELSMGMSADFEAAIANGSTNVRVGSNIFGARPTSRP